MIDPRYDENINENEFYQKLKNDYKDLIDRATRDKWIICVPRVDSFQISTLTEEDFLTHILVPNDELPETHFRTLSGKQTHVRNKVITVENEDIANSSCTHIIFEETFYTEDLLKYKVWCLESPLNKITFKFDVKNGVYNSVNSLRDCINLLWNESLGKILEQLDGIIEEFSTKNEFENCSLQTLKDLTNILYAKCLQTTLQDTRLREKTSKNNYLLNNIKISIENYMQHGIYKKLFLNISVCTATEDANFNKIVRNLYDLQIRDLKIQQEFVEKIPCAKRELAKINGFTTILGKINCLRLTLQEISKKIDGITESSIISADILIPIFVFLILKSNISNWIANLVFLKQFQNSNSIQNNDEVQFLITTLEASIEHIRSGQLLGSSEPESYQTFQETDENLIGILSKNDFEINRSIYELFDQIRTGNVEQVKVILSRNETPNFESKLCHPLCFCDKCERLISKNKYSTIPTVYSCDDRGYTPLHIACMYGQPQIVEFLLENKANLESCDYSGATPLHYAAMRGHQNALLLVLHSGADMNCTDSEKNTPLHFCSNNGHEACVKAMLYFSEHQATTLNINCCNNLGNSPLHHAARWGYESIVQLLLEYGADIRTENKQKKTALDCAHNLNIYRIILQSKRSVKRNSIIKPVILNKTDQQSMIPKEKIEPQNLKKIELLLRSVALGDIPLISYYLGLNFEQNTIENDYKYICHPLCNCEKCFSQTTTSTNDLNKTKILDINVCNSEGFTPLHVACLHGQTEVIKLLLNQEVDPNLKTKKGLTPLHLACQTQRLNIIKLLLKHKNCDINSQDNRGNTPLHYACYANDQKIIETLIFNGADPHIKNTNKNSALQEAQSKLSINVIKLLQCQ